MLPCCLMLPWSGVAEFTHFHRIGEMTGQRSSLDVVVTEGAADPSSPTSPHLLGIWHDFKWGRGPQSTSPPLARLPLATCTTSPRPQRDL